jgi:uncharacterized cupredoxin-like copper-binding protein
MSTASIAAAPAARRNLPSLTLWTAGSLIAAALLLTYMQLFLFRSFDPPLVLIFGLPALVFAGLVARLRRRWAPLLGALYWLLFLGANAPYLGYDLLHPETGASFVFAVILLIPAVIGVMAGMGAAVENYRPARAAGPESPGRRTPGWYLTGLAAIAGLALGAIAVAGLLPGGAAGVSVEALANLPALSTAQLKFDQGEIRVKAGETVALRLENQDASGHSFDIDELNVHAPMPPGEPSLALFRPGAPGTYTFYCAVPGHRAAGMTGALIVEP